MANMIVGMDQVQNLKGQPPDENPRWIHRKFDAVERKEAVLIEDLYRSHFKSKAPPRI